MSIKIVHVVAMDSHRCIGKDNALLWHIPADLQHFRALTSGKNIIMGRKTFESLGRLLPKRTHHVITTDTNWHADGVIVAHSIDDAIANAKRLAQTDGHDAIYIIGGGQIYKQTLHIADVLEITHVETIKDGDTFYPVIDDGFRQVWHSERQVCEKSGLGFYFARYEKM